MFDGIFKFILSFGLPGIFALAVLDSTFIFFMPFAIDWLFIILVSRHRDLLLFFIILTVVGSVVGTLLTYFIISKMSEQTLEKHFPSKRLEKVKQKLAKKGFIAILIGALLPPPFPFTPFTIAASIAKMPLKKLIGAVLTGRGIRFTLEGLLALAIGGKILRWLEAPAFRYFMMGIFGLAVIGSTITIVRWARQR